MITADVIASHAAGCGGSLTGVFTTPSGLMLPAGKASMRCDACSWQIVRDVDDLNHACG